MYPVMLQLKGRRCLVVGGGGVALRKVQGLLQEGAQVVVVSPKPLDTLLAMSSQGRLRLELRTYRPGEVADYVLVFAATDDREVNQAVYQDAEAHGVWANVADDPELCSFHLPSRVRRGALQLAVGSAGQAPFAVRRMRQMLERKFGPEWAEWADAAARFRASVISAGRPRADQEAMYDAFFSQTIDPMSLKARVPSASEEREWLALTSCQSEFGDDEEICHQTSASHDSRKGFVSLVGAGPGDPGLLTLRARQRLMRADVVVYDNLALPALPCDLPEKTELHCVGKQAGHHPVPQHEINAMLLRLADQGKRVVRLKGGDPFVFGRGGEEAEALAKAGIAFEVVPAVTAGVAVPSYAGIPITHRQEVVRVTFVTAHESEKTDGPQVRWDLLGQDPHATLIGYMGVTSLPQVVERLLQAGMDPNTPAAMIERGTTAHQRSVISSLSDLPNAIKKAGMRPPGLFVIGPTVRHAGRLDWYGGRPLAGQRLAIMEPSGSLGGHLEENGAQLVEVSYPLSQAARVVIGAMPITGCVLRTESEVEALDEERISTDWGPDVVAWCLSKEAAVRARALGWPIVKEFAILPTPEQVVLAMQSA